MLIKHEVNSISRCMIKMFMGAGVVNGEGDGSERCLKCGGGVIKGSFLKHLKTRGG